MLRLFYRNRQYIRHWMIIIGTLWTVSLLLLHISLLDDCGLYRLLDYPCALDTATLQRIMKLDNRLLFSSSSHPLTLDDSNDIDTPLSRIHIPRSNMLTFYDLPKSKSHVTYGEITSANRDTTRRLAPDFTFHIDYERQHVTIYEDYGPGCVFRIFLYPALSTDSTVLHRMTSSDLHNLTLLLIVDNITYYHSLDTLMLGSHAPFLIPMSTGHKHPKSGIGAYVPICYQQSMIIKYRHDRDLPADLLSKTINCIENELACPTKIYSAVSRHKYPYTSALRPYHASAADHNDISLFAQRLASISTRGPDSTEPCVLDCVELCAGCQRVLHHVINSAGVIAAIKFRVFSAGEGAELISDWSDIFLSVYFDFATTPQINKIPLSSLFGAAGSLNDYSGVGYGRLPRYCTYRDNSPPVYPYLYPYLCTTGYMYLAMPFWSEALVVIERSEEMDINPIVCFQLMITDNFYDPMVTGHLHAVKTYYGGDVGGWRGVLDVSGGWGHVVGVGVEIDNLRARREGRLAERWAALQADTVIYVDGVPAVLGTGLEDYFSYAHGFSDAANTTYSFVGVYHGQGSTEPLTWHTYRQHILDPIPFRDSIKFIMEGTDEVNFYHSSTSLNHSQHRSIRRAQQTTLAHLVLYYFHPHPPSINHPSHHPRTGGGAGGGDDPQRRKRHPRNEGYSGEKGYPGGVTLQRNKSGGSEIFCDTLKMTDKNSEREHNFELIQSRATTQSGRAFSLAGLRYVGHTVSNQTEPLINGRGFMRGDVLQFTMNMSDGGVGAGEVVVLRRTFHSLPLQWNDAARISVNNVYVGTWFIPLGTVDAVYSLRREEITLARRVGERKGEDDLIVISIEPLSERWRDVEYQLCRV